MTIEYQKAVDRLDCAWENQCGPCLNVAHQVIPDLFIAALQRGNIAEERMRAAESRLDDAMTQVRQLERLVKHYQEMRDNQ